MESMIQPSTKIGLPLGLAGGTSIGSPALASLSAAGSPVAAIGLPAGGSSAGGEGGAGDAGTSTRRVPGVGDEARLDGAGANLLGARNLGLIQLLLSLLGLRVAVEVQINHDVPLSVTGRQGATETEDLTSKHPPDQADGVAALVVGGDSNIDELGGRVSVAQGNDRDVDIAGLLDGLGVGARVRHDNEARLLERAGDVVGEVTGGEAAGNGGGTGVRSELEHGTLTVGTGRDDSNVSRVVHRRNDTGSQDELLPGES